MARWRVAVAVVVIAVVGAIVALALAPLLAGPTATPAPSGPASSGAFQPGPTAGGSEGGGLAAVGVANDEPCTRTLPPGNLDVPAINFHHEDLERMVLTRDDVGGLAGFEVDVLLQGYHDNVELPGLEVNPPTTCDAIRRLGRLEGYGNGYGQYDQHRSVLFAVHLFWTDVGASAWTDEFVNGLAAGATAGGYTLEVVSRDLPGSGATLVRHRGADGTRTWAFIERGPIVGWIVDLHPDGPATIDVPAAAAAMATRIEHVVNEVAARGETGLDAADLLSVPLPQSAYGRLADGLGWDAFFGGCHDTAERGFIAGEQAAADAQRLGRVTGCTAMYAPPGGNATDVVRLFSSVSVYRDETGAAAAIPASISELLARNGVAVGVSGLGDQATGVSTPAGNGPADTRVVVRVGSVVLSVAIQRLAAHQDQALVLDLARQLVDRLAAVTGEAR